MLKLTLITTTLLLFLGCATQHEVMKITTKKREALPSQNILNVPIHIRDKGYKNFSTKIFTTQSELDSFLKTVKSQSGWNKKDNFIYILKKQNIDFAKDYLVIYRFDEASDSIIIATDVPVELDRHITVNIGKTPSAGMKKLNMAHYALAYIVDKDTIDITFDNKETKSSIKIKTP